MKVKPSVKKILEMAGILKLIPIIENIEEVGGKNIEKCI
jgi:anti-anti-sigma regulatory factor